MPARRRPRTEFIEDPASPGEGLLLVADGGRRYLPSPTDDCDHEEGQVWGVLVGPTTISTPTSAMWPLDATTLTSRTCTTDSSTTTEPVEALDWARYDDLTTEFYIGSHGSGPLYGTLDW